MQKLLLCLLFLMAVIFPSLSESSESTRNVVTKELKYMLLFMNGTTKNITVRYEANLIESVNITGGSKKSILHPIDTQRYEANISGKIFRTLAINQGNDLLTDKRFHKEYNVDSDSKVFQNFSIFYTKERESKVDGFINERSRLMSEKLRIELDKIINDQSSIIRELRQNYPQLSEVTRLDN